MWKATRVWGGTPKENEKKRSQQAGAGGVLDLGTDLEKWFTRPLPESKRDSGKDQ